jgi:parvulin-like peptidyl-prolyl isomerase
MMKFRSLVAALAVVAMTLSIGVLAKDKKKARSGQGAEIVATVNGEPVTKDEWTVIWKMDQWHAPMLKSKPGYTEKMAGKPYEDYFFREEIVKIRAMAQRYRDTVPQMKASIDAIYEKAKAGDDFAALARDYSQDEGSAANGGDLGEPKEFQDLVFPFNRIAFKMKEGEISEPLMTVFGYHILKVERVWPAGEGKGRRISVRNILIEFPSPNAREESESLADEAKVEVLDGKLCKKLVSYCEAS